MMCPAFLRVPGADAAQQQQQCQRVIQQLQKALQCERRQLRQLRAIHTAELGRRNELQALLLDSLQQAKQQYQQAQAAAASAAHPPPDAPWRQMPGSTHASHSSRYTSGSSSSHVHKAQTHMQRRRPASAAPSCGGSRLPQQAWVAADGSHGAAAAATAATGASNAASGGAGAGTAPPLRASTSTEQAEDGVLKGLWQYWRLLEQLLERACPDFVHAAQQLQHGQTATLQLHQQEQCSGADHQQDGQPAGMLWSQQPMGRQLSMDAPEALTVCGSAEGGDQEPLDMWAIHEDDGVSEAGETDSSHTASEQHVSSTAGKPEQQQQQQGEQVEACSVEQQQAVAWQQQQQEQWVSAGLQRRSAPGASCLAQQPASICSVGSHPHKPTTTPVAIAAISAAVAAVSTDYSRSAGPVCLPLASMSRPMMGSFPVRKLLHSGGSSSSSSQQRVQHAEGSLQRTQQHRRSETAAAASSSRRGTSTGHGGLAVRPISASVAAGGVGVGRTHSGLAGCSTWQSGSAMGLCQRGRGPTSSKQCDDGGRGLQQQQQLPRQHMPGKAGVPRSSGRHSSSSDGSGGVRGQTGCSSASAPVCSAAADGQEGLSICSWSSRDDKAAQQMLRAFLSSQ